MRPSMNSERASRVARKLAQPETAGLGSILILSATQFDQRPEHDEVTQPTGFDPGAVSLFEAIVESAYLVATADGSFDEAEENAFRHIVLTACGDVISETKVSGLLADLSLLLDEEGVDRRIAALGESVRRGAHAREVLRTAALMAQASSGVSAEERALLERLRSSFALQLEELDRVLAEVRELE